MTPPPIDRHLDQSWGAKVSTGLAWLTWLIALVALVASYEHGRLDYRTLHNSDAAFARLYYRDILTRGIGAFGDWELPTNPYFLPDFALYIPIDLLVNEPNLATILFGVAQFMLTTAGLLLLQRHLFGPQRMAQNVTLLSMSAVILHLAQGKHIFYYPPLMPLHHFGVLVVLPFATLLLLRGVLPGQSAGQWRRVLLWLGVLTLLTALSDSLFIIQFVLPAFIALLVWGKDKALGWGRFGAMAALLPLAAALGQWLRLWIVPTHKFSHYINVQEQIELWQSFALFRQWAEQLAFDDPWLATFWLTSFLALFAVIAINWRRGVTAATRPTLLVATLMLLSVPLAIAATLVSGNFTGHESTRYFLSAIYLPLFTGWPLLLASGWQLRPVETSAPAASRWVPIGVTLATCALLGYTLRTTPFAALATVPTHQDPFVACLLRESTQRNLRDGLAEYWQANYVSALSQGRVHLAAVTSTLTPELWNGNLHSYRQPFDFVVSNPHATDAWYIREEYIREKFGPPTTTFTCDGSTVYVYERARRPQLRHWFAHHPMLADFSTTGEVRSFYGYTLPSPINGVAVGLSQGANEEWDQDEGMLAYAPLKALPPGRYAVAFDLFTDHSRAGAWEVVALTSDGPELLASAALTQTGKSTISGAFDLQSEADVDVGVKYNGRGALYVDQIRVVRLDVGQESSFAFDNTPLLFADAPARGELSLVYPADASTITHRTTDLVWQWTGAPLPPDQTFEVRLWRAGDSVHYGAHDAAASRELIRQVGDSYMLRLDLNGAHALMQHGAGDYAWTVAVVAITPAYQDLQIEAAPFMVEIE